MITTFVTVIIVSAFFILFFKDTGLKNKMRRRRKKRKMRKKNEPSTTAGFVEDTSRDPFIKHFIPPKVGNIGKFVPHSSIPENHWLHGFPHKKSK